MKLEVFLILFLGEFHLIPVLLCVAAYRTHIQPCFIKCREVTIGKVIQEINIGNQVFVVVNKTVVYTCKTNVFECNSTLFIVSFVDRINPRNRRENFSVIKVFSTCFILCIYKRSQTSGIWVKRQTHVTATCFLFEQHEIPKFVFPCSKV